MSEFVGSHTDLAVELLAEAKAAEARGRRDLARDLRDEAHLHAMLALVEQQRAANVVAAINQWGGSESHWPFEVRKALGVAL